MTDLINTLESPGEFDALTSLRPGEPYFLLVGRDRQAPKLVQQWADNNRRRAFKDRDEGRIDDAALDRELRKSTDAERIGWAMESFKRGDKERQPTAERSGTVMASEMDEATRRRDALQSSRSRAASAINAAAAELNDLLALLDAGEECLLVGASIDELKALSDKVKPFRPGIAA